MWQITSARRAMNHGDSGGRLFGDEVRRLQPSDRRSPKEDVEEITSTQRPLRPQRMNLSKRCFARFAIFAFNVMLSQALKGCATSRHPVNMTKPSCLLAAAVSLALASNARAQ